jgi:hypothetical protein
MRDNMNGKSEDIPKGKIKELKKLFPEAITEGEEGYYQCCATVQRVVAQLAWRSNGGLICDWFVLVLLTKIDFFVILISEIIIICSPLDYRKVSGGVIFLSGGI